MIDTIGRGLVIRHERAFLGLLLLFLLVNEMTWADRMPFFHEEARRAIVAQEMLQTGDMIVPTIYGAPYYRKPPMHNWAIVAASIPSGEVTRFSSRLVSALSLVLMVYVMYGLMRKLQPDRALLAAVMLGTNYLLMMEYGAQAETDAFFALLVFLSIAAWMWNPKGILALLLSSQFMGMAILTKGIAPLFIYPPMLVALVLNRSEWKQRLGWIALHLLLACVLPAMWVLLYAKHGDLGRLIDVLMFEAADRTSDAFLAWLKHLVEFPVKLSMVLLPWSAAILFARTKLEKRKEWLTASDVSLLFLLGLFILLPGMLDRYFIPAIPFFVISVATRLDTNRLLKPGVRFALYALYAILATGAAIYQLLHGVHLIASLLLFTSAIIAIRLAFVGQRIHVTLTLLMLLSLILYRHGIMLQRSDVSHDHRAAVRTVVAELTNDDPVVVSRHLSFKVGVHLMGELKSPVLLGPFHQDADSIWYVTTAGERFADLPELVRVPNPDKPSDDLILQRVPGKRFSGMEKITDHSQ